MAISITHAPYDMAMALASKAGAGQQTSAHFQMAGQMADRARAGRAQAAQERQAAQELAQRQRAFELQSAMQQRSQLLDEQRYQTRTDQWERQFEQAKQSRQADIDMRLEQGETEYNRQRELEQLRGEQQRETYRQRDTAATERAKQAAAGQGIAWEDRLQKEADLRVRRSEHRLTDQINEMQKAISEAGNHPDVWDMRRNLAYMMSIRDSEIGAKPPDIPSGVFPRAPYGATSSNESRVRAMKDVVVALSKTDALGEPIALTEQQKTIKDLAEKELAKALRNPGVNVSRGAAPAAPTAAPSGRIVVEDASGNRYTVPAQQRQQAIDEGYRVIE